MKLREYFQSKQESLSSAQKTAIYGHFLDKIQQYNIPVVGDNTALSENKILFSPNKNRFLQGLFTRAHFWNTVVAYSIVFALVGLSIYLPFLAQDDKTINHHESTVQADFIAKIVNVTGGYFIESNGKRIDGKTIADGDNVILAQNSFLIFTVNEQVEGKITGPASFVVNRTTNGYAITLKEGTYLEVASMDNQGTSPELAVVSQTHKFNAKTTHGKQFHFILAEKNNKPTVTNKADADITITNNEKQEGVITLLAENKTAEIGIDTVITDDVQLLATKDENAKVTTAGSTLESSYQSGFFKDLLATTTKTAENTPLLVGARMTTFESDSSETNLPDNQPKIDRKELRDNLIPEFVRVDVKYLTYYYLNGSESEYQIAYKNMLKRVFNIYDALHIRIPSSSELGLDTNKKSLHSLTLLTMYLRDRLPSTIPQVHVNTIDTLGVVFERLETHSFGEYKDSGLDVGQLFKEIQ